jgi:hypothetical protein
MFPASSDGACNFSNTEVEVNVVVLETGLIARNEDVAVRVKQEAVPERITSRYKV